MALIEKDTLLVCPACGKEEKIQTWNNISLSKCINPKARELFMPLYNEDAYKDGSYFYSCPHCKVWSEGCKIKIKH